MKRMDPDTPPTAASGENDGPIRVVTTQLARRYAPVLGDELVATTVRTAFTELRDEARVQQFVALLAQRRAEERLRQALVEATEGPSSSAS
jgi:hypothetical protein